MDSCTLCRAVPLAILLMAWGMAWGGEPAVREVNGRLTYGADAFGNVVPDFSMAGYRHGGVPLPEAEVVERLKPAPGAEDDTARIQAAIDRTAKRPQRAQDGVRGAVLLERGAYRCAKTLIVPPGVTLRGEGPGADGTVITATMRAPGNSKPVLIRMSGGRNTVVADGPAHVVLDDAVPLGARRMRVAEAAAFAAGDAVMLERKATSQWIHDLRMDQIRQRPGTRQWSPAGYHLRWQARVVSVEGEVLTLDTPVICALEKKYGGGAVYKCKPDPRGRGAALERLRLDSIYAPGKEESDEDHAWDAIAIEGLVDCWVRDVTALHFSNACVRIDKSASRITVQDCAMLDPVSEITGGRRYSFSGAGQYLLFQRCYARNGRHDFVNGHSNLGPTVYLDCLAEKTHADIGPHHRWASGHLYDNIKGGQIRVQDRGPMGSGHGWAGNCQVLWNCEATALVCQKPWIPSAQNWAIGCVGQKARPSEPGRPDGYWESFGDHVRPRSLYLAQLRERFDRLGGKGEEAVRAVTTTEQRDGRVWEVLAAKFAGERQVIRDTAFRRGFTLVAPAPGKRVPYGILPGAEPGAKPAWDLDQWSSRFALKEGPGTIAGGRRSFENEGKRVVVGEAGEIALAVNGWVEYGGRARKEGEPWVHLLLLQPIQDPPSLAAISSARLRVEAKLLRSKCHRTDDYSPALHAAQAQIFFSVQNRNRGSKGYGSYLWFGIPLYDDRARSPGAFHAKDTGGTEMFIFTPAAAVFTSQSAHDGDWITIDKDLLPLMRDGLATAWKRGFLADSQSLADYRIAEMNLGWEVPGLFDVEMQFRKLGLTVVEAHRP